jgi:TolB-like protein/DNA-binding winged helix-turn-helix (wHTH) protein/Flp pilus assembly protein TadD
MEAPQIEAPVPQPRVLRFGIFELDTQSGELRRHGLKVRLPDQSFQILQELLNRPGEVVTREDLRRQLWTSDTFVDFDVGLNSAIRKLREALEDSADNPRFVETLPRRGYRFIAPLTPIDARGQTSQIAPSSSRVRRYWIAAGMMLALAVATAAFVYERRGLGRGPSGAPTEPIQSLAVLPFENLTGDPAQDYFVDGVTDALTTDLAQVAGLRVISRTSAMQYKHASKPMPAIGQELGVDAALEGAIVRSGDHVRITAQLIHAKTDRHVWARSYEGEMSGIIALQQEISRAIVVAIDRRLALQWPARPRVPPAVDPRAYDAYLKGVHVDGQGTDEAYRTAVAYYEDAVRQQPDFAAAYAAMALAQVQLLYVGSQSPRETIPKAEAAARKALQLDDTLTPAHRALGAILRSFYWQWEAAGKESQRAGKLETNIADTQATPVRTLIFRGRFDEAMARARKSDPVPFNAFMDVAGGFRAKGEYDRAIEGFHHALELDSTRPRAHFELGVTFVLMGRLNEAIGELETSVNSPRANQRFQAYLGYAYAAAGRPLDARRILQELESRAQHEYVSSFGIALIYDALGEKEPALSAFERAYQDRAVELSMASYPPFKTIPSDSRFQTRMNTIGLPRRAIAGPRWPAGPARREAAR